MDFSVCSKLVALIITLIVLPSSFAADVVPPSPVVPEGVPSLVWKKTRIGGEFHRAFDSPRTEKKQGFGLGFSFLFPLIDSGFDLGFRYSTIDQEVNSFTMLNFVFDYFIFPSFVRGLYVGGEVGITDPNATNFFSVYDNYVFVAKAGYEYWVNGTKWSTALEFRRSAVTENPIKMDRQSHQYSNGMLISARYSL